MIRSARPIRTVAALAVGALGMVAVAACGAPQSDDGRTVVQVWHGFTEADGTVVQEIADDFNASQDDYRVEVEVNPWNVISDKLMPAVKAGNGPDLVVQGVDTGQGYVNRGVFQSLEDFYDDPANETDTYYDHVVDYGVFDGEHYAVPMGYAPYGIWFNKKMFAEAGVTEPPKTWDEMFDLARRLTVDENGDGKPEIYGLSMADKAATFLPWWLAADGGTVYDGGEVTLDSPANVATLERWRQAYAEGWGPTNVSLPEAVDLFKAGKAAMVPIGPWMIGIADSVDLDVGVFEMPSGTEKVSAPAAANYWWLTEQAQGATKSGAYDFMRYFNSHESQVRWGLEANYPPNRTDIGADELAKNPYVATMQSFVPHTDIPLAGIPEGITDINAELDTLSVHVTQGSGGDVGTLTRETDDAITDILSEDE